MHVVITGAAGFIGSSTVDRALSLGWRVTGIDCFTAFYDRKTKESNIAEARENPNFTLLESDLLECDLDAAFEGVDAVVHLAAQPGVRPSWELFSSYLEANVRASARVVDAALRQRVGRVVYSSSSSVYGDARLVPTPESAPTHPRSPYGVTKLAAEHLFSAYASNFDVPVISLRYFTVYGPRQRPDMATYRLIESALRGTLFPRFGDGSQRRDFTYVDDIVSANLLAVEADVKPGTVVNLAGGSSCTLSELIDLVGIEVGTPVNVELRPASAGDVFETGGDTTLARAQIGWSPRVSLTEGLRAQVAWHRRAVDA